MGKLYVPINLDFDTWLNLESDDQESSQDRQQSQTDNKERCNVSMSQL